MNNLHIYPITCQEGRSYLELLFMRLRWGQLGLIQNLQAPVTVEKKHESVGRHLFGICEHGYLRSSQDSYVT